MSSNYATKNTIAKLMEFKSENPDIQSKSDFSSGNLLIVDDDIVTITLMERIFKDQYVIRTAMTGERAIDLIHEGFIPQVILSDHFMPGMTGIEFLECTKQLVPEAIRVLMTGNKDIANVIDSINNGSIYRYITKPCEPDVLSVVIRQCYDYYYQSTQNRRLLEEVKIQYNHITAQNRKLEQSNVELVRLNNIIRKHMFEAVKLLSSLMPNYNQVYYTNHSQSVGMIARAVAEELSIDDEKINQIVIAALLHDIGKVGIPEKIVNPAPDVLSQREQRVYQTHSERGAQLLNSVSGLEFVSEIVHQHHEKVNGTGFPRQLQGDEVLVEASIISIANCYHNRVFRIPTTMMTNSPYELNPIQTDSETQYRQAQAISYIYRHSSWFHADVLQAFYRVAQKSSCTLVSFGIQSEENDKMMNTLRSKYGDLQLQ